MNLEAYLFYGGLLFALSLVGMVLNKNNIILLLVCIELMLLAVNTNFVAYSHQHHDILGQIFVFFILTVAAAEAAIGLAIVILLYRNQGNINVAEMNNLKG
jgi:NADH-quinone oxidoreductase subunit K